MKRMMLVVVPIFVSTLAAGAASAETLVVANKAEATASLIDLVSGDVVATLPTGVGPHEVGVSPDGTRALVTNYGRRTPGWSLTLVFIPEAQVLETIDLGEYRRPHGVEYLDQRYALVTAETNKVLIKVDVERGEVVEAIDTDQDISHMVALAPDRKRAFLANIGSGSITAINLETNERLANIPTGDGAEGVAVVKAGDVQQVWVTNRAADTVTVLDAASLEKITDFESKGFPIRATATPGGKVLVTRARAGDLVIYDTAKLGEGREVAFDIEIMAVEDRLFGDRFGDSSVPIGVVIDDAGTRAFVAHANADVITEVDLETGAVARQLRAGKEPDGMGFSPREVTRR